MSFYLFKANYSTDAVKAMVNQPQDREATARGVVEALGGTLHHFFFALGDWDIISIIEVPDDKTMVAGSLIISASGNFSKASTTKLMTASEAKEAMGMAKDVASAYTPPTG